jgi:methionyl-tRNA formyltransferase
MSVIEVDRLVRATTKPYPGAFIIRGDKKVTIWKGIMSETKIESKLYHEIVLKDGFFYSTNYEVTEA